MKRAYIKNLEYKIFTNFGKKYLTVDYNRGGEHNHITYSNIPNYIRNEKTVRKFLNS